MAYKPKVAVVAEGGTGLATLTSHALQVGNGTGNITQLGLGTNGQVLVGSTGADPAFATVASSNSSITFATGAGTLGLTVTQATESQLGGAEIATQAEVTTGTSDTVVMTPLKYVTSLASPPAIGGTAAAAGTFTTFSAGNGALTTNAQNFANIPLNPWFIATIAAAANQTGDSTVYTLTTLSELKDVGNNFASNTYTVPTGATGCHHITCQVTLEDLGVANTYGYVTIITTTTTYENYTMFSSATSFAGIMVTALASMSAGHTAIFKTAVFGGAKVVDITQGYYTGRYLG